MTDPVRDGFSAAGVPADLVEALISSYEEAKRRFHLGDFRPNAIEGGRFCEAAFRILQFKQSGKYTPLGDKKFNTGAVTKSLENDTNLEDEERFHIPRALRVIYDVRNNRNTGHLGDGKIDPNLMDSSLVIGVMDWVMAEFVRIFRSVSPEAAQATIDGLVQREVPVIEVIDGHPVLNKKLDRAQHILVLLYRSSAQEGITLDALMKQLRIDHKGNLRRALERLVGLQYVHVSDDGNTAFLTGNGRVEVEAADLLTPER